MKKTIIVLLILSGSYFVSFAQNTPAMGTAANVALVPASLPVLETYVPESVILKLKNKYADKLYDITAINDSTGQAVYVVRTEENGIYSTQTLSESEM